MYDQIVANAYVQKIVTIFINTGKENHLSCYTLSMKIRYYFMSAVIALATLILDQVSKSLAVQYVQQPFFIIPDFFSFEYHENTGIAFSLPAPQLFIIIATCALIAIGIYFAQKELNFQKPLTQILFGISCGGAIGNLIDRILFGSVRDFIAIGSYPVFNIADMGLTIGILGIVFFARQLSKPAKR